ncbi:hypothetical protein CN988_30305, partial [Bacillus thuringiensis]
NGPIGTWYVTKAVEEGNTGKLAYESNDGNLILSSEARSKLDKNSNYYLSMYLKANFDTEAIIEVSGENSTITSKKVKLNSQGYQRVDILVQNSERNPIDGIDVRSVLENSNSFVLWDDVSITNISA